MNAKFIASVLITLTLVGVAWKISHDKAPQTEVERGALYPGLLERLNDIARVSVRSAKHATDLVRADAGDTWQVANRGGFPAAFGEIKRSILEVAGLVTVEAKTARADGHARIGVADLEAADADGTVIEAFDANGARVFGLIVGHAREGVPDQHYVRRLDEEQAWLAAGALALDADPIKWLDARIVDVDTQRVRRVTISAPDEPPVVISKHSAADNFFSLENVPDGYVAKSKATVSSIGALLLDLRFNDVAAASKLADAPPRRRITLETFDGLVTDIEEFKLDDQRYARFAFRFDPSLVVAPVAAGEHSDEAATTAAGPPADASTAPAPAENVADTAARLAERTAGWVYVLPDYKLRMIDKRLADLIQKPDAEKPVSAGGD